MFARRSTLCLVALGLCSAGLAWIGAAGPTGRISPKRLVADQPYAVAVAFDRARLDLEFDDESRYLLILGSLGGGHDSRKVTLSSEAIKEMSLLAASRLARHDAVKLPVVVSPKRDRGRPVVSQQAPAQRHFHLHVTDGSLDDPRHYVRVTARLVGEGREVRVYLDCQQTEKELSNGLVENIVQLLDEKLLPRFRQQVGGYRDVDGDGKFTVLLSPWLGKLQGGKTSLGGFVRESDFRSDIESPFSNRCDMMYLNSNLQVGAHLQTLLAHEFMHAVSFSARLPSPEHPAGLPDEEDWLNEAIAHLSENLNGDGWSNLDYRISRYLSHPQEYPLVVDDYYHAGLWRNHGCRGATYLFLRWCVDEFGVDVLNRLIHGTARGRENLRQATGLPFEELFRRWTIALYLSNRQIPVDEGQPENTASSGAGESDCVDYCSLDLRGRLGNWGLAGPRPIEWTMGESPLEVSLSGTSAAYVLLEAPSSARGRRIQITSPFGTKLQVTLIKLPSDDRVIDYQARWIEQTAADTSGRALQIEIAAPETDGFEVEHVSFSRNEGETKETVCFAGEALKDCRIGGANLNDFAFPLPMTYEKWLATVVTHDKNGRRAARFIDVPAAQIRAVTRLAAGKRRARKSVNR